MLSPYKENLQILKLFINMEIAKLIYRSGKVELQKNANLQYCTVQ